MEKKRIYEGKKRSNVRSLAIVLLIIVGCSAIMSGLSFITDPSGKGVGINTSYLTHSPFQDYRIPGIFLFAFNGVLGVACAMFAMRRFRQAPAFIAIQGWVLMIWIVAQVAMLQEFNLLHAGCLAIGLFLAYAGDFLRKRTTFDN